MPLNVDYTGIKSWREVCYNEGRITLMTEIVSMMMMQIHMDVIDEHSAKMVWARINIVQKLQGALGRDSNGNDVFVTERDVVDHIGLRTNVSRKTGYIGWVAPLIDDMVKSAMKDIEVLLATELSA